MTVHICPFPCSPFMQPQASVPFKPTLTRWAVTLRTFQITVCQRSGSAICFLCHAIAYIQLVSTAEFLFLLGGFFIHFKSLISLCFLFFHLICRFMPNLHVVSAEATAQEPNWQPSSALWLIPPPIMTPSMHARKTFLDPSASQLRWLLLTTSEAVLVAICLSRCITTASPVCSGQCFLWCKTEGGGEVPGWGSSERDDVRKRKQLRQRWSLHVGFSLHYVLKRKNIEHHRQHTFRQEHFSFTLGREVYCLCVCL